MKIKTKLIISFCIIIFVPSILAIATISAYCNFQSHVIEQTYGIKNADAYSIINSVPLLNRYTALDFEKIKKTIKLSPSKMEDAFYLTEINEDLKQKYSYLVVRVGEEISFNGGSKNEKILSELPGYGENSSRQGVDKYIDRDDEILVKQVDFKLDSGEKCTAYIVTSFDATGQEIRQFVVWGIICVVIILLLTAIMMIVWIYRSMITPIQKLRVAAENIKEGNLDFALDTQGDDEIGELCTTFEQMRQRLKDNAEEKLSNEKENRALISNIAHDLKTPITVIKGYAKAIADGIVSDELKLRGVAKLQGVAQLPAQEAGSGLQSLQHIPFLILIQNTDINFGIAQVSGGVHTGDGDHAYLRDAGILQTAKLVCQLPLDLLIDASDTVRCHKNSPF